MLAALIQSASPHMQLQSVRGRVDESAAASQRALRIDVAPFNKQSESVDNACLAERALWFGELAESRAFADRAWRLAHILKYEADFILAARVQGAAALGLGNFAVADVRVIQYS